MDKTFGRKYDLYTSPADPAKLTAMLNEAKAHPWKKGTVKWNTFIETLFDDGNLTEVVLNDLMPNLGVRNWDTLMHFNLSEYFLRTHRAKIGFDNIFRFQSENISTSFIDDYVSEYDNNAWYKLSMYVDVSEKFIEDHLADYKWNWVGLCSRDNSLSEDFIERHLSEMTGASWFALSFYFNPDYSWDFVERHKNEIDWETLCFNRWEALTPEFVERFEDEVSWISIKIMKQPLISECGFTEEFFKKHKDRF